MTTTGTENTQRDVVRTTLSGIFTRVFEDDSIVIRDQMTAADVEGWDSLTHISLIVAVERAFKIKFTMAEITRPKNVGELIDLIIQKMG